MSGEILEFLKINDVEFKQNYPLSLISPIRIGGVANIIAYPDNERKLINLINFICDNKNRYFMAGRMSNILPKDDGYSGVVIRTDRLCSYSLDETSIEFSCGVSLPRASVIAMQNGLSGLEALSGIPGSVAGAVVGNAGSFGREIGELVSYVRIYDLAEGSVYRIEAGDIGFSYRYSSLYHSGKVILSVGLSLSKGDKRTIQLEIDRYRSIRLNTQPCGEPSLGSVFKRPREDLSASLLIDKCGLKGYTIGRAQISSKHAGFIVNKGGATAMDYLSLADYAAKEVKRNFDIDLTREIKVM